MRHILQLQKVEKFFQIQDRKLQILSNLSFEINKGEIVAIVGPSGSGKTTLLGLMAGLDKPSNGQILIDNIAIENFSQDQLAKLRNEKLGFIFQNFQLLASLTALENVMIPMELKGEKNAEIEAKNFLEAVGLGARIHHFPRQLSGGEQQRVAIARAFASKPLILFADEPTGNLDEETSDQIEKLLFKLNKELNTTLVIVTHDMTLAAKADRILRLKGGKLIDEPIDFSKA